MSNTIMRKLTIVFVLSQLGTVISQSDQLKAYFVGAESGDLAEVKKALAAGVDPNLRGKDERTVLHYAARNNHPEVVKLLLDAGADIDVQEEDNEATPLYWASKVGQNLDTVKVLLDAGADPNIPTTHGVLPVFIAAFKCYLPIFKALIEAHSNIRLTSDDGKTALHYAAATSDTSFDFDYGFYDETAQQEITRILLRKGADTSARDNRGMTPSDYARENHNDELADIIESYAGPYDPIEPATPIYDLYLLSCGIVVVIADTLYSIFV